MAIDAPPQDLALEELRHLVEVVATDRADWAGRLDLTGAGGRPW